MSDTTRTQLDLDLTRLAKRIEELITILAQLKEKLASPNAQPVAA